MATSAHADTRDDLGGPWACHAEALSKWHGERDTAVHALRDVTLSIRAHAFTAVMGPSGSGKSTLLHCLAALDTPTSGRVFLGDTELTALSRRKQARVRRDRIGFVFQSFNLVPTLDALENITLPQLLAGRAPDREWLEHVIDRIGLGDRLHHRPSELSGGQQQRIALARALAGRPEVIFADEPTGNLDTSATGEMLTLLRDAVDQFDQTVVTVTHDPSITDYADQIVVLMDGRVVDRAAPTDVGPARSHAQARGVPDPGEPGGTTGFDGPPRPDRQQTMRSRRRRHNDDAAPGRPMVGSDDEVEVARQERWLERIRAQFEAEHADGLDAAPDTRADAPTSDPVADDTHTVPPPALAQPGGFPDADGNGTAAYGTPAPPALAAPLDDTVRYDRDDLSHTDGRGDGAPHHPPTAHQPPAAHDRAAPDDGNDWLPTERSWLRPGAKRDTSADRDTRRTDPPPAPWSRPPHEGEAPPAHPDPAATQEATRDDPWAPVDHHRAEEYRWGDGQSRHPRRNGHRGDGEPWTTGRWRARQEREDAADLDRAPAPRHEPPAERDQDVRASAPDVDGGEELDGWTIGARPRRHERPGDDADRGVERAAHDDPGAVADDAPSRTRRHEPEQVPAPAPAADGTPAHEPEHAPAADGTSEHDPEHRPGGDTGRPDGRAGSAWRLDDWTIGAAPVSADDRARDPWTDVWDASIGDDLDEVWTPAFDSPDDAAGPATHQPTAFDQRPDAAPTHPPAAPDEGASAPHERRSGERDDQSPAPDPRTAAPGAAHEATEQQAALPTADAQPVAPPAAAPRDHRMDSEPRAEPEARDHAATPAPEDDASDTPDPERVIDVTDAPLPPPLASLRSPRRPDQEDEALAALHSLQDQLQRLERGRGARSGTGRRDPRDVGRRR